MALSSLAHGESISMVLLLLLLLAMKKIWMTMLVMMTMLLMATMLTLNAIRVTSERDCGLNKCAVFCRRRDAQDGRVESNGGIVDRFVYPLDIERRP